MAQSTLPTPDTVDFPGRVLVRTGFKSQIPGAALRTGEIAATTDNWWGWFGDESANPPNWPTSKTNGDFDWTLLNPTFNNINVTTINGKTLDKLINDLITSGPTPVITIINENISKTVYGPNPDFVDLEAAYSWLSQRTISIRGSVTLIFPALRINDTKSYVLKHPNGERIIWKGSDLKQPLPSPSVLQVSGTSAPQRAADLVANLALLRQSFATEIAFSNGGSIKVQNDLGEIRNMLLTSDGVLGAIGLAFQTGRSGINNVGTCGFGAAGIQVLNSATCFMFAGSYLYSLNNGASGITTITNSLFNYTYGTVASLANTDYGIFIRDNSLNYALPAANNLNQTVILSSGNVAGGLFMVGSILTANLTTLTIKANAGFGMYVASSSQFRISGIFVQNNSGPGVVADGVSTINMGGSTVTNNTGIGIQALNGSYIFQGGTTITGNGTATSPAIGTVGNTGALITT